MGLFVVLPTAFAFAQSSPAPTSSSDGNLFTEFFDNPVDNLLLLLAALLNAITAGIGKFCLLLINLIVVPILGYNNFSDSNIIGLGWSLVRDVVNMFVVVILLVIALMTIVGSPKANWTQQLPRLFIAVVLVNFSRTICGFLIDISQVIMFTFVNAILDIAAGNFAQLLGIIDFGELDSDFIDAVNASDEGLDAMSYLIGAVIQLALYLSIFGVMTLLAIAFIWRIVILWVLVIMSPIAFLMVGVKDLFGKAGGTYTEWWGMFTSALIMGPTLAFFLWLSLAAASGSNLAVAENFPMPEDPAVTGLPLKQTSLDSMTGLLLALVLLIAGVQQASKSASALGGLAAKVMKQDLAEKLVKGSLKYSAKGSTWALNRGAGAALRGVGLTEQKTLTGALQRGGLNAAKSAGNALVQTGAGIAGAVPIIGGALGGTIAAGGSKLNKSAGKVLDEQVKASQESVKGFSGERKKAILASMASGDQRLFNSLTEDERNEFQLALATDTKLQKDAKDVMGTKYRETLGKALAYADDKKDDMDDARKDRLDATKTANLDLLAYGKSDEERKKAMTDHLGKMHEKGKFNSANAARLITEESLADEGVREALGGLVYREGKNSEPISALRDIQDGKAGKKLQDALASSGPTFNASSYKMADPGAEDEAARRATVIQNINRTIESNGVGKLDGDAATAFKQALQSLPPGAISVQAVSNANVQLLNAGKAAPEEVFGRPTSGGAEAVQDMQIRISQTIQKDPTALRHLESINPTGFAQNVKSQAVVGAVSEKTVNELGKKLLTATGDDYKNIRAALDEIQKAITAEISRGRDSDSGKRAQKLQRAYDAATRYSPAADDDDERAAA